MSKGDRGDRELYCKALTQGEATVHEYGSADQDWAG